MVHEEKTIETERIYEGKILNLRRDKVTIIGEKTSYREIIEHSGGVTIAAITDQGKMVFVKQYRKAAEQMMLEAPAGKLDVGEEPALAAARELKEETGYTAKAMTLLTSFYSSVGYSNEYLHLYLATGLTPGETQFDIGEAIDLYEYDIQDAKKMVMSGEIHDAKTIAAVMMGAAAWETSKGTDHV